jgi:hypothetical protein
VTGKTAAELIHERADALAPNMGEVVPENWTAG